MQQGKAGTALPVSHCRGGNYGIGEKGGEYLLERGVNEKGEDCEGTLMLLTASSISQWKCKPFC